MLVGGLRQGGDLSRRRVLVLLISGLTLLATIPVIGHHALGAETNFLDGRDNLGSLCLVALHIILGPVHSGFHAALALGIVYAAADRGRAWLRMNRVIGKLDVISPLSIEPFRVATAAAGVDPAKVRIVDGLPNPAFTAGWWKPRIYLSAQLADTLSPAELERLVSHERAHLDRRDPLRLAVLRFFACMLFWMPALRKLAADVSDEAEFEADDIAASGKPLVLASAILTVAAWKQTPLPPAGAAGFSGYDLVEQRVRRLSGEVLPSRSHVTTRSLIAATAMLAAVVTSGVVVTHPLHPGAHADLAGSVPDGGGHRGQCRGHEEPVFFHLLCGGLPFGLGGVDCPHHDMSGMSHRS